MVEEKIISEDRLNELYSYQILDTLPDEDYDNLTRLAAQICGTKISLVSLVDSDRQWFKSKQGIDVDETPRNVAFCSHAIEEPNKIFIIPDAREDERFKDNPFVTEDPKIAFYAGVPLNTELGYTLGTICVMHDEPKELTEDQISALETLGKQVVRLLELKKNKIRLENSIRDQQSLQLKLMAAHINPNLIYSSLISFQSMMLNDGLQDSLDFASEMSNLIRRKNESASKLFIPIEDELENIRAYIGFEKNRTRKNIYLQLRSEFMNNQVLVPPFISIPIISNAIVHGFAQKKKDCIIQWSIKEHEGTVIVEITDNGIGREAAMDTKSTRLPGLSQSLEQIEERLAIYSQLTGTDCQLEIIDLKEGDVAMGTKVILKLPLLENRE